MRSSTRTKQLVQWGCVVIFIIIAGLSLALPRIGSAAAPEAAGGKMPETMILLDDAEKKHTEFSGSAGKTPFDHDQHIAKEKCATCHHTNSSKLTRALEEEVRKCSDCHKQEESTCELEGTAGDKKFKGKTASNSKEAFHGKGSELGCIGCHDARSVEPVSCKECHTDASTIEYKYKK